ncbi:fimbrial protein [Serratia quinivorans]|jgi:type 1 fimbria pilin|uniref:fimbrial protein n=1 Tax=Serratia quinivorans TaxID=137545 RepID=UPI001C46DCA9|nr:spore coat protein U domain-containing protein [Serratia quinivorans]MBV6694005.1 spore coat protein U domain-containing protein [Serratia quinivorans]
MIRSLFLNVGVLCTMLCATNSALACNFASGSSTVVATMAIPDLVIDKMSSVGTVLWKGDQTAAGDARPHMWGCAGQMFTSGYSSARTLSSYGNNVYDTNIAGIGIRVTWYNAKNNPQGQQYIFEQQWPRQNGWTMTSVEYIPQSRYIVEIVKTASTIHTGTVMMSGNIANSTYGRLTPNILRANSFKVTGTVPTCTTSSAVTVNFGQVNPTTLSNAVRTTTIGTACESGTSYNLALKGTVDSANGNLLKNTGTAKGLGIRVTNLTGALTLIPSSTNSYWFSPTNGVLQVRSVLEATGSPAEPTSGTISALATLTINYQ